MLELSVWREQSVRGGASAVPVWMQMRLFQLLANMLASMSKKVVNGSFLLSCLSFTFLVSASFVFSTTHLYANQLTVNLLDAQSGQAVADTRVYAYELNADGSKTWVGSKNTDVSGQVIFDVDPSLTGANYFLTAKAFSHFMGKSEVFSGLNEVDFALGSIHVSLFDGTDVGTGDGQVGTELPPLANTQVSIFRLDEAGKKHWFASAKSDENGIIRIDAPTDLQSQGLMVRANSPVNGHKKYSQLIDTTGNYQFVVGNPAFTITLVDDVTEQALVDTQVSAYRLNSDGSKSWYARYQTDETGSAVFDLNDIQAGAQYVFRAKVYNDVTVQSQAISNAGHLQMRFGTTRITLLNGAEQNLPPLANTRATVYKLDELGDRHYYLKADSDDAGLLRLNLADIDQGSHYILAAKSTVTGETKYSQILSTSGEHQVVVGSRPLNVVLADFHSNQVLSNERIDVYEVYADGSDDWFTRANTDNTGLAVFDLPGLGQGRTYRLRSRAFDDVYFYSSLIQSAGLYNFLVGNTQVTLKNGADANLSVLPNTRVTIYRINDGKRTWVCSAMTDENGVARFDLQDIGQGAVYQFKANSLVNGQSKYSAFITQTGEVDFVVGNPAVTARLFNLMTGEHYVDQPVTAYRIDSAGDYHWHSRYRTDANGEVTFDLEGINAGVQYRLKTSLFSSGSSYSDVIASYGDMPFGIGAVPITLIDQESQNTIADKRIYVYKLHPNGELEWMRSGRTDENGVETFDLPALGNSGGNGSSRYVFKAKSPFGEGKSYYGPVITSIVPVEFYVKKGEFGQIDTQAPTISIDTPSNDLANAGGFIVAGSFNDDVGVGMVELTVVDPQTGSHTVVAQIDESNQSWQALVSEQWLTLDSNITVTATAYDFAFNTNQTRRSLLVSADMAAPRIVISSHRANDNVNVNGFILIGTVDDDIGVQGITASLTDSNLGQTVLNQPLTITNSIGDQQWAFGVTSSLISEGGQVLVSLSATDINGKTTLLDINLNAVSIDTNPLQLAERITFGLTTQLLSEVKAGNDILTEQLNPQDIDDSAFETQMAQMQVSTTEQLQDYLLMHMIGSKKQLNEVMAWFWENHFNTDINTHQQVSYELTENQLFRQHALGNFRTLLEVSAKSPAMIRYLNNQQNVAGAANENYAREVMELHTLGVDGGYDGNDVAELARIFTGWHELNGQFAFNDELHDNTDKVFLGQNIVGSGVAEGEQVLDILAAHPSTASYICSKLITLFVSDTPVANLQSQCAAEFIASSGDIRAVLLVILQSETFNDPVHYRNKVKTPLELTVATARGFATEVNVRRINELLTDMGMNLFRYPVPTGFSERAADWINSNALLQRMSLVNHAVWQLDDAYVIDVADLVVSQGFSSVQGAISLLFELALAGEYSQLEYQMALDILHADEPFDLNQPEADEKLQRLLATVLSFPAFQYQ